MLATFAEFEADLLSLRTREGMRVAKAKGRLKGKPLKLSAGQPADRWVRIGSLDLRFAQQRDRIELADGILPA